jgi:heme-degrading monooxygenase HmoA
MDQQPKEQALTVARRWNAIASPEGAAKYSAHFAYVVMLALQQIPGFRGALVLQHETPSGQVEIVDITFWESREAITAFAGADISEAVVDATAQGLLQEFDATVTHYEVTAESLLG